MKARSTKGLTRINSLLRDGLYRQQWRNLRALTFS